jgi:hypothetical protein
MAARPALGHVSTASIASLREGPELYRADVLYVRWK